MSVSVSCFQSGATRDVRCGEVSRGVGLAAETPGYVTAIDLPPIICRVEE